MRACLVDSDRTVEMALGLLSFGGVDYIPTGRMELDENGKFFFNMFIALIDLRMDFVTTRKL